MKLNLLQTVPNFQAQWYENGAATGVRRGGRFCRVYDDGRVETLGRFPYGTEAIALQSDLYSRLTRRGVTILTRALGSAGPWIVGTKAELCVVDQLQQANNARTLWPLAHGRKVLQRGVCMVDDSTVIAADYWRNPEREPVHIYKIDVVSGSAETIHTFPAGDVRHVHNVQVDPYGDPREVWFSTGDEDAECQIAVLNIDSGEMRVVGRGDQAWRTVSLAFTADAVYWGSDNHTGANAIFKLDRKTGQRKRLNFVTGPVYYNVQCANHVVFSTAMEKGEGEQDGFGRLYGVDCATDAVQELWRARKDRWPPTLFGYGIGEFAVSAEASNRFWVTPRGLAGGFRSLQFELVHWPWLYAGHTCSSYDHTKPTRQIFPRKLFAHGNCSRIFARVFAARRGG